MRTKMAIVSLLIGLLLVSGIALAAEPVQITVATGAVGQELEISREAAARYMELHPDVKVTVLDTPDMVQDRLGLYLQFFEAQSSEVDVYQVDVIWPGDLAEHFLDLYEYGGKEVADLHFPEIVENNTVDGKLVAIPWFTDAGLLYYRTDLLKEYGLEPPTTWDELEAAAKKVQADERAKGNQDFWGYVWQGNAYEGLTCNALEWLASNDGDRGILRFTSDFVNLVDVDNSSLCLLHIIVCSLDKLQEDILYVFSHIPSFS
jgi:trehalose/maltose transport system substrate-binding protein